MLWQISWRNVWRNKLRSSVVITAICLGIFAGIFSMAFMRGMADQRLESAINTQVSHIQIHSPEFMEVNDIQNYIEPYNEYSQKIDSITGVISSSGRILVNAIMNSAEKGMGVKLFGIDPSKEKLVSNIHEKIIEGNYLDPLVRGKPILIGENLAKTLEVKLGSKLVAGMVDSEGHPVYYQFRVGGIFKTVSTAWDESNAFVNYSDLLEITNLPIGAVHEIAIFLTDEKISYEVSEKISFAFPAADVKEWDEIMPELSYLNEQMDTYMYIFILIILFALGFGIVNTMLMVVLERVKEIGMLMAVGMNKKRVFGMIMLETVFLSLSGGAAGIFLGGLVSKFFEHKGINLTKFYGEGLSAYGYDSIIFTSLEMHMVIVTCILVLFTGMIASVFPAIRALRLNPASAIRSDI